MPRQVDHEERRRSIAEALWRIVSSTGLEGVSLRHVATEAGVSMGRVQHYFTSKDEMLLFAFETMSARVEERLCRDSPQGAPLRSMLMAMLPLDDERRAEAHVAIAFMARAAVEPAVASRIRATAKQFGAHVAGVMTAAGVSDADEHATALLAMLDGMTAHVLMGLQSPESAVAALDAHLDRLGLNQR